MLCVGMLLSSQDGLQPSKCCVEKQIICMSRECRPVRHATLTYRQHITSNAKRSRSTHLSLIIHQPPLTVNVAKFQFCTTFATLQLRRAGISRWSATNSRRRLNCGRLKPSNNGWTSPKHKHMQLSCRQCIHLDYRSGTRTCRSSKWTSLGQVTSVARMIN